MQQIVLQTDSEQSTTKNKIVQDPDVAVININVEEIVHLLVKEQDFEAARAKAEEMEKENSEIQSKLIKKEHELDSVVQEKEDLETNLTRMRERLEKESANHSQTVQRALNAEMKVEDLQHRYTQEQHERLRLERLVTEGSIPDDQKISGLIGHVSPVTPKAPPPPPPMMITISTPPPPPPPGPKVNSVLIPPAPMMPRVEKKNIPQPSNPLKSFNWSKLPEAKVQGTIWSELDDSKLYTNIDLESIDKLFSAYQKNGVMVRYTQKNCRLLIMRSY